MSVSQTNFQLEALESRLLLSAEAALAVGAQPLPDVGTAAELMNPIGVGNLSQEGLVLIQPVEATAAGTQGETLPLIPDLESLVPLEGEPDALASSPVLTAARSESEVSSVRSEGQLETRSMGAALPGNLGFGVAAVASDTIDSDTGIGEPLPLLRTFLVQTLTTANAPPISQNAALTGVVLSDNRTSNGSRISALSRLATSAASATTVNGTISSDATWAGTIHITGDLTIDAGVRLTISAGAVLKFDRGAQMLVNGVLDARGTTATPIVFTASRDDSIGEDVSGEGTATVAAGDWRGLVFGAGAGLSVMQNVEVRYAGNIYHPGHGGGYQVAIAISSSISLIDVTVRNSDWIGIRISSDSPKLTRVKIDTARDAGLAGLMMATPVITDVTISGTALNGYRLEGDAVAGNLTWDTGNLPLHLASAVTIPSGVTLTIVPGQVIKLTGSQLIIVDGTLQAIGTAAEPIVFTSANDDSAGGDSNANGDTVGAAGEWTGLVFNDGSDASVVQFAEIRYAGNLYHPGHGGGYTPAIRLSGTTAALSDVLIRDVDSSGVSINSGSPKFSRVQVVRARHEAFNGALMANPDCVQLGASQTGGNQYVLRGGSLTSDRTWFMGGLPIYVQGDVIVEKGITLTIVNTQPVRLGGHMTIATGGTVKIAEGEIIKSHRGVTIIVDGTLTAIGTAAAPIIFTAHNDDSAGGDTNADGPSEGGAGEWRALAFNPGSDQSILAFVEVRFAGNTFHPGHGGGYLPSLSINSSATFKDVLVRDADARGIQIEGGSPQLVRVSVLRARYQGFAGKPTATPVLRNLSSSGTSLDGAYFLEGGDNTISTDWTWDFGGVPVQLEGHITVAAGVTLTILAGHTFRFYRGTVLSVNGKLNAIGTADAPIIFTCYRDPSEGTAGGEWQGIDLNDSADGSVLQNVQVRYAGNLYHPGHGGGYRPAVRITGAEVTMTDVIVSDSDSTAVRIVSGAPTLTNVAVVRARHDAFYGTLTATPVLTNLSATDASGDRYALDGGELPGDRTLWGGGLPIELYGDLTVPAGKKLVIAAGQVLKFSNGEQLIVEGTLEAIGTENKPIVLTSWRDDAVGGDSNDNGAGDAPISGDWQAVFLNAGSDASVLDYVEIRYAGNVYYHEHGQGYQWALRFKNTKARASHLRVYQPDWHGIRLEGGAPTLENVRVESSARGYAFWMTLDSDPKLSGLASVNNPGDAFVLDGGTLASDRRLNIITMPYVLDGNFTIAEGVKLTLDPGVVFKLSNEQAIEVSGTLDAQGSLARPIVFTSRRDDTALGDTWHDGDTPAAGGNWAYLRFTQTSKDSVLDHVDVRYAGNIHYNGHGQGYTPSVRIEGPLPRSAAAVCSGAIRRGSGSAAIRWVVHRVSKKSRFAGRGTTRFTYSTSWPLRNLSACLLQATARATALSWLEAACLVTGRGTAAVCRSTWPMR